jgi:hypothetical protein
MALVAGCASYQMTTARVALLSPLAGPCIADSLRSESDVVDFRERSGGLNPSYKFEIADSAHFKSEHPDLVARQTWPPGSTGQIEITATFSARLNAATLRAAAIERQQAMLSRVVERCAGIEPNFGPAKICGKGEKHTLCVQGELP